MSKTHRTAMVLVPPQEVWPPIQAMRQAHDRHYGRWMPHITLIYPFRPRGEWQTAAEGLRQACAGIEPFEIELATFCTFAHRSGYTLWLAPEPKDALLRLQTALWRVVPECDETRRHAHGFTPHLSVGQVRGRERRDSLLGELRNDWMPIRFQALEVNLIWRHDPPDDVFRVGYRIELGTEH